MKKQNKKIIEGSEKGNQKNVITPRPKVLPAPQTKQYKLVESEEKWGIGDKDKEQAFDTVSVGEDIVDLIFGQHPHSRQDNRIYARTKSGEIYDFDGHRLPFKIEIELYNYIKCSHLSGDEIRKGGTARLFLNGQQIFEDFCRSYESGYKKIDRFVEDMELNWSWYPKDTKSYIGRVVGYREQLCKISRFIIDQACMILETLDGKPFKKFLWEDNEDYEKELEIKVNITDPSITWYPKQ